LNANTRQKLLYFLLTLFLFYCIAPYLWLFIQSFVSYEHLSTHPPTFFPHTVDNYLRLFGYLKPTGAYAGNVPPGTAYLGSSIRNSLIASISSTLFAMILASLSAYSFARIRFRGRDLILMLTIALRMLPVVSMIIPIFLIFKFLHLIDTLPALIIVYTATLLPYDIWMLTAFFQAIPSELDDAARIDGCNRLQALTMIALPLAKPGLVAVGIFNFLVCWNEFFVALILTRSETSYTLPVIISMFTNVPQMLPYDYMITAGVVGSLPPLLLAMVFGRHIMKGLVAGALR
jgi:multiple sugar transport system permease protein